MCESNPTNSFSLASSYSTDEKTGLKWSSGEVFLVTDLSYYLEQKQKSKHLCVFEF